MKRNSKWGVLVLLLSSLTLYAAPAIAETYLLKPLNTDPQIFRVICLEVEQIPTRIQESPEPSFGCGDCFEEVIKYIDQDWKIEKITPLNYLTKSGPLTLELFIQVKKRYR